MIGCCLDETSEYSDKRKKLYKYHISALRTQQMLLHKVLLFQENCTKYLLTYFK